jgi:hypothetical protein
MDQVKRESQRAFVQGKELAAKGEDEEILPHI